MSRTATKVARVASGSGALPSTEEMLADGSFHARLAKARVQRERVLSGIHGEEVPLRRQKPWEDVDVRAIPKTDNVRPAVLVLTPDDRFRDARVPGSAEAPVLAPVPQRRQSVGGDARSGSRRRKSMGVLLVVAGFLVGVAIGAGLSTPAFFGGAETSPSASDLAATSSPAAVVTPKTAAVTTLGTAETDGSQATRLAPSEPRDVVPRAGGVALNIPGSPAMAAETRYPQPQPDVEGPTRIVAPAAVPPTSGPSVTGPVAAAMGPLPNLARPDLNNTDQRVSGQTAPQITPPTGYIQTVFLHAPASLADAEVEGVFAVLTGAGVAVRDPRRVAFAISRSNVRYFHDADAAAATRLADEIGAIARDFTTYRPSPPVGTIEVWLAGRSSGATQATPNPQRAEQDEQLLFLRRLILEQLLDAESQ